MNTRVVACIDSIIASELTISCVISRYPRSNDVSLPYVTSDVKKSVNEEMDGYSAVQY